MRWGSKEVAHYSKESKAGEPHRLFSGCVSRYSKGGICLVYVQWDINKMLPLLNVWSICVWWEKFLRVRSRKCRWQRDYIVRIEWAIISMNEACRSSATWSRSSRLAFHYAFVCVILHIDGLINTKSPSHWPLTHYNNLENTFVFFHFSILFKSRGTI